MVPWGFGQAPHKIADACASRAVCLAFDVDRDIGRGTGWGNLPDKDREKAMQEIGREFPSHYREVIEEYFRRLAAEESADHP